VARAVAISSANEPRRPSHVGVLGSSVPGAGNPAGYQRRSLSRMSAQSLLCQTLAMPLEKRVSTLWKTCGRREREADAEERGAILVTFCIATVEGTSVFRMALPFAGHRRNEDLGRSDSKSLGLLPRFRSRRRQRVPSGRRGGERSSACAKRRMHPSRGFVPFQSIGDASFTRSRDPCSSIVTQRGRRKPCSVTRSLGYRDRANPRKWEEPVAGS
jgi:hypothetical protein